MSAKLFLHQTRHTLIAKLQTLDGAFLRELFLGLGEGGVSNGRTFLVSRDLEVLQLAPQMQSALRNLDI
jgi:hypothetical protein